MTEESNEWGPSLLETPGPLAGAAGPRGGHLHLAVEVHTRAVTGAWRHATGSRRGTVRRSLWNPCFPKDALEPGVYYPEQRVSLQ